MGEWPDPPQRDRDWIVFQPVSPEQNKKTVAAVRAGLAQYHHFDPKDDKATPEWDTVEDGRELRQFTTALDVLLGLIGALTLGVAGVGVMNIMLASVTDRTREMGLRTAPRPRP